VRIAKLVVVGVGLIGGSFALALRRAGAVGTVVGVGRGRGNLDVAKARGIVDRTYTLADDWTRELFDADVVLVAAPVAQYPSLFEAIAPAIGPRTVVTDAGSTKQDVVDAAQAAFKSALSCFVPAHPVAGSERTGADAARAALFDGRNVVLTPSFATNPEAIACVSALWSACGARVTTLTPEQHDCVFAVVSHLPHLLAFAFVDDVARRDDGETFLAHAGTGFRDFTRIAASSSEMWRDIALANRDALQDELIRYRDALAALSALLENRDGDALAALFERAARARKRWGGGTPPIDDEA